MLPQLVFKVREERQAMPLPELVSLFILGDEVQLETGCILEDHKAISC